MHSAQYGKSNRQKKQNPKNVNSLNLGVATYVVQFEDGHKTKLPESSSNHRLDNIVVSGSSQNLSRILTNRQKDHHGHLSSSHFSEPSLPSNINKSKQNSPYFSYNTSQALSKPLSPVGAACEQAMRTHDDSPSKLPKAQVYLPGERVIFAESPSAPGIPIVYRLEEERKSNPDKLNLDRRKLSICPILEGEENIRLLNFQHNRITKIQHLIMMKKLIFLDFYDNHIDEISGLSTLKSLRVLMLGKNRIKKINNLLELTLLDVLDLHGNKITKVENVSHLHQLRVLNLAGNELTTVKNLAGLTALSELNLRRNKIHTVLDIDQLPSLQRLFLSFNDIKSFDDICCLAKSTSLVELALDGNPFCTDTSYKQIILQNIPLLWQLDMKRLTEEEKRIAYAMAKKEDEKKKEAERLMSMKEKRRLAINNAQRQWTKQFNQPIRGEEASSIRKESEDIASIISSSSSSNKVSSISSKMKQELSDYSYSHLVEVDADSLNLYGPGSLDAIDKNWGEKTANGVLSITFKFINFSDIVPVFKKLHSRFPSLESIHFELTNISTFNDINGLVSLTTLQNLHISDDGNPITKLLLWKPYTIYRLTQLNMKTLNGEEISDSDVVYSEKMFGELSHLTTTHLSQWRLFTLFALQKERNQPARTENKNRGTGTRSPSAESVSKAGLFYRSSCHIDAMESAERDSFSKNYFREILQDSIMVERKQTYFEKVWPQMLKEMINKYCVQISDVDTYCKQSLEKIKKSVNVA